jgi:hypothetical protein
MYPRTVCRDHPSLASAEGIRHRWEPRDLQMLLSPQMIAATQRIVGIPATPCQLVKKRLSEGRSVDEKASSAPQQSPLGVRMPTRKSYRRDSFTSSANGMVHRQAWQAFADSFPDE